MTKLPLTPAAETPGRFTEVAAGDAPPLYFDPAAVLALEPAQAQPNGARSVPYRLHLAGGQTIELAPAIADAVLLYLGLTRGPAPKHAKGKTRNTQEAPAEASPIKRPRKRKSETESPKSAPGQFGRYVARLFA